MDKKEITILDLVKIALNWIWVLLLGAVVCAAVAFFYSTKMVTPMYSASSKYVIQTKGQEATDDVLQSQRTVAYAQLVVGTYIDIVDTRNFASEVAEYMNGEVGTITYTKDAIDTLFKYGILVDRGIVEDGMLRNVINELAEAGILDASAVNSSVADVAKERFTRNRETLSGKTTEELEAYLAQALNYDNLFSEIMNDKGLLDDVVYSGMSSEKIEELRKIGLGNTSYSDKEYEANQIAGMISFSSAEESTTFTLRVTSPDAKEAYTIARLCEIIMADYIENIYPGTGIVSVIDSAQLNENPINNNTALLTLVGFMAGFILAFVVVYIIELADNRVKNQEELAEKTGLSVMGIIPDTQLEKNNSGAYTYGYGHNHKL
ncbi:MAG: hypothetical protein J6E38_09540 [Clostridia bacterium]|nr:hypothetical protein [Clostridia bacterium]